MKIAIDARHLAAPNQAGVGQYTIRLIHELTTLSPEDHFFLFAAGTKRTLAHFPTFEAPNVTVVTKNLPNRFLFVLFVLRLRTMESFLPQQPDVWLFPNHNITHTGLPYVLTVHDLSFDIFPSFFTIKDRLRAVIGRIKNQTRKAQHLLAVSESTKRDLVTRWNIAPKDITVTPLGVDSTFSPKVQASDRSYLAQYAITSQPYLLCLSTREPRKNLEAVVEAYGRWATNTSPDLIIAGARGWKSSTLDRLIEQSQTKGRIRIVGYVHEKHKPALLRHARAVLFPSFYEGFGLPPLEALACNTIVIAAASGSLPEILNTNVILVDSFNVTDLVQALKQMNTHRHSSPLSPSWRDTAHKTRKALSHL